MAPAKLAIELRWGRGDGRRVFRLSTAIDPDRIAFAHELPFPTGEPCEARFRLPGEAKVVTATVEIAPREACFRAIDRDARAHITAYCKERLGLS
jgi:hypothetical protein